MCTFVPLDEASFQVFSDWFAQTEGSRYLEAPTRQWFDYVRNTPGNYARLALAENASAVGHVHLEIEADQWASVALFVRPDRRGHGHGRRILRALLDRPEAAALKSVEAMIATDNVASLRCFTAASFVQQGAEPDSEGFLRLVYTPSNFDFINLTDHA